MNQKEKLKVENVNRTLHYDNNHISTCTVTLGYIRIWFKASCIVEWNYEVLTHVLGGE